MKKIIIILALMFSINAFADEYTDLQQAAVEAGVPEALALSTSQQTQAKGFSTENMVRLKNMIQMSVGSEAEKITAKVAEGMAKNVAEPRIMAAAAKIQSRYEYAAKVSEALGLSGKAADEVTDSVTDAMAAGATEESLSELAAMIQTKTQTQSRFAYSIMQMYKEMMQYGVAEGNVSEVAKMAASKLNTDQINEYRKAFAENAAMSGASETAAAMKGAMSAGKSASSMGSGSSSGSMGGSMGGSSSGGGSNSGGGGGGGGHGGGGRK